MATKISNKVQEHRPPPYLGNIPKKTIFWSASLIPFFVGAFMLQEDIFLGRLRIGRSPAVPATLCIADYFFSFLKYHFDLLRRPQGDVNLNAHIHQFINCAASLQCNKFVATQKRMDLKIVIAWKLAKCLFNKQI